MPPRGPIATPRSAPSTPPAEEAIVADSALVASRVLAIFVVVYMLSILLFFVTSRYRLPVVPFLIVFAAVGIDHLLELARNRNVRELGIAALVLVPLYALIQLPLVEPQIARMHSFLGYVHATHGEVERATAELQKAVELEPNHPVFRVQLAESLERRGDLAGAIREYTTALRLDPTYPKIDLRLDRLRGADTRE